MRITNPPLFEEKLANDIALRSAVDGSVTDFSAWLQDSKLPFFPDYTDHGPEHLTNVLATACALLTPDARGLLTPADVAILTLAVLLHDSALHLSEAGFKTLISGDAASNRIAEFDQKSWNELWREFLFTAKRWDDSKLVEVLGLGSDGKPRSSVRDPFSDYDNLTESDRRLVGEFIRQHHTRMAHEFAIYGVPGPSADAIKPDSRFNHDMCDIAGLVARSHGLPARSCLDYLSKKYHRREYKHVHAVFLMILLRVADGIQIQASRAPKIAFRYRHIPSPKSILEWKAHNAITNITQTHDDPESIEIQALPSDVLTYLRLKDWLAAIQDELDGSWAVLGEVYGSQRELSRLGLIIRRVRSNLDQEGGFATTVSFVPKRIELDVARADLLKLLIRPLYGNRPEIGIRELVQNSLDAVRERIEYQHRHPQFLQTIKPDDAAIDIWLQEADPEGKTWLIVSDCGIGMTPDVIQNYFLKAGASYRQSDAWRHEFESDEVSLPSATKSRVLRSGRFGIGALAAFLLGDEIEVQTRHISAQIGVKFRTRLDATPIELRYESAIPVGTTIRIKLSAGVFEALTKETASDEWDWYCFQSPVIRRAIGKERQPLPQRWEIDLPAKTALSAPRSLIYPGYEVITWRHEGAPALACNGIRVGIEYKIITLAENSEYTIRTPNVSVLDPDGTLPLTLQREALATEHYPFKSELLEQVIRDLFAFLLIHTPRNRNLKSFFGIASHPAFYVKRKTERGAGKMFPWVATQEGLLPFELWNLRSLSPKRLFVAAHFEYRDHIDKLEPIFSEVEYDAFLIYKSANDEKGAFRRMLGWDELYSGFNQIHVTSRRLLTGEKFYESLRNNRRIPKTVRASLKEEWRKDGWISLATANCPESAIEGISLPPHKIVDYDFWPPMLVELFLEPTSRTATHQTISFFWEKIFGSQCIPFDWKERTTKLSHVFKELEPYVRIYQDMPLKLEADERDIL